MHFSRRAVATLGVLGGTFLAAIEATIVATAMPTVAAYFGDLSWYAWVFSAYVVTSTVTMPLWGRASDLYGRRRLYLAAVGLFLAGSALSGAAPTMSALIVFRAIQGVGAGGLLPLGMTILGDLYSLRERARTQALFASVWGLASIAGPLVGGYITDTISWRWVFYLNLPFGAVAATLVGLALVDPPRGHEVRLDARGALAMIGAVGLFMLALAQVGGGVAGVSTTTLAATLALSATLFVVFVRCERTSAAPIVPLDLLADRLVATTTLAGFLVGLAMFGTISFVPLYVQTVLGGTARDAGRVLMPLLLGWVAMSMTTGRLLPRVGHRPLILVGVALINLGLLGLVQVSQADRSGFLYVDLALMGMGMGTTLLSLLLAVQAAVPRERLGVATSVAQFSRSIGGALGVSVMGAIVAVSLPAGGEAHPLLMEQALHRAFVTAAVVAAAAFVVALRVPAALTPVQSSTTAAAVRRS
ncbi:MAG: MFS transporter [Acidobacteria bacterium]|nr:MFS transporter [Acidobacteriota bacterium]